MTLFEILVICGINLGWIACLIISNKIQDKKIEKKYDELFKKL